MVSPGRNDGLRRRESERDSERESERSRSRSRSRSPHEREDRTHDRGDRERDSDRRSHRDRDRERDYDRRRGSEREDYDDRLSRRGRDDRSSTRDRHGSDVRERRYERAHGHRRSEVHADTPYTRERGDTRRERQIEQTTGRGRNEGVSSVQREPQRPQGTLPSWLAQAIQIQHAQNRAPLPSTTPVETPRVRQPAIDPYRLRDEAVLSAPRERAVFDPSVRPSTVSAWSTYAHQTVHAAGDTDTASGRARIPSRVSSSEGHNDECILAALASATGASNFREIRRASGFDPSNHTDGDIDRLMERNGYRQIRFRDLAGHLEANTPVVMRGPSLDGRGWHAYTIVGQSEDGRRAIAWDPDHNAQRFRTLDLNEHFFDRIYAPRG